MLVTLPRLLLLDYWPLGQVAWGRLPPPAFARHVLAIEKAHLFLVPAAAGALTIAVQARSAML